MSLGTCEDGELDRGPACMQAALVPHIPVSFPAPRQLYGHYLLTLLPTQNLVQWLLLHAHALSKIKQQIQGGR